MKRQMRPTAPPSCSPLVPVDRNRKFGCVRLQHGSATHFGPCGSLADVACGAAIASSSSCELEQISVARSLWRPPSRSSMRQPPAAEAPPPPADPPTLGSARPDKEPAKRRNRRAPPRCQVLNCTAELATAYCRKRHCCTNHMRAEAVRRRGQGDTLWRFCFQCGRLEPLSAFEANKRSCRQRLIKRLKPSTLAARAAALTQAPSSSNSEPTPASPPQQQGDEADEAAVEVAGQHAQPWLHHEDEQLWPQLLQQCSISHSGQSCPPGYTSSDSITASTVLLPSEATSAGPLPSSCGSPAVSTPLGGSSSAWPPALDKQHAAMHVLHAAACGHAGTPNVLALGLGGGRTMERQQAQLEPTLQSSPPSLPPQQQQKQTQQLQHSMQPSPGCSPGNPYSCEPADAYATAGSSITCWQAPAAPATALQQATELQHGWADNGRVPAPGGAASTSGCHGGISDAQLRYLEHKFAAMQAQREYTDALQDALASLGPAEAASITHAVIHGSSLSSI